MRKRTPAVAVAVLALLAAACGDDANDTELIDTEGAEQPPAPSEPEIAVISQDTDLGPILVDSDGMTLYAFTNDADGQSECDGECANQWPPLTVGSNWDVGPDLDPAIFNAHTRDDGTQQLVAGQWPLYTYSGDAVPGDINGQDSGGVWFVVSAEDASLVQDELAEDGDEGEAAGDGATDVQVGSTDLGDVLTDAEGLTLYGLTEDADALPTCTGECAGTWPPLLVEGEPGLADPLEAVTFTTVDGAEGGTQVVAGIWPLYTFSGDSAPGDINGQEVGDVWFAVAPDGTLIGADTGGHDYD